MSCSDGVSRYHVTHLLNIMPACGTIWHNVDFSVHDALCSNWAGESFGLKLTKASGIKYGTLQRMATLQMSD